MSRPQDAPHVGPEAQDAFPLLLERLLLGRGLDEAEAQATMESILTGGFGAERLAALLTALRAKGVAVDELVGFARAMRARMRRVEAGDVVDTCGTGGAAVKTVNLSTAAAFVLAASGLRVAKHGNRSITRPSGSADVLEASGADLGLEPAAVAGVLRGVGIAFLFAPVHHPAMAHAAPVRRALGVKTVFNLLGPLCNPAGAAWQVVGVHEPGLVAPMADALARLGCRGGFVLHGEPGTDEATPMGPVHHVHIADGRAGTLQTLDPLDLGIPRCAPQDLAPVPPDEGARLLEEVLSGRRGGPVAHAVALNAAFGLVAAGRAPDLATALAQARHVLASGAGNAKREAYLAAARRQP